jgi:hypothetical protein
MVAEKNGTGGAMADLPKCAARKIQHATPRGRRPWLANLILDIIELQ